MLGCLWEEVMYILDYLVDYLLGYLLIYSNIIHSRLIILDT